jgi:hypothetical protein
MNKEAIKALIAKNLILLEARSTGLSLTREAIS